jgi:type I restriction enzyme S subunit
MGTTNLSISREDFLAFPVALPPRPDLKPLLSLVSALSRRFEDESAMISLTALRDALLPKLLSGELRVPEAERLASEVL